MLVTPENWKGNRNRLQYQNRPAEGATKAAMPPSSRFCCALSTLAYRLWSSSPATACLSLEPLSHHTGFLCFLLAASSVAGPFPYLSQR